MESVSSCVHMHSSGNGDIHSESLLQCEEHNQCLSSPQDSDTSAQSYQNASVLSTTPVTAAKQHPLQCPFTSEPTGPLLVDVSPYALAETYNIAFFRRSGYIDPTPATAIFQIAATYGFTTLTINVGTSYLRRLAASNDVMMEVGLSSHQFCPFMLPLEEYPPSCGLKPLVGAIHATYLTTNEAWLTLIHLTCIYIAAKNLEYVPRKTMLQTIIGRIYGAEACNVPISLVTELELECLAALDWRLGPFYRTGS
ncbi:hypothetical protein ABBQ38_006301 [Trebouxia sp. C0009 RCD-2024]